MVVVVVVTSAICLFGGVLIPGNIHSAMNGSIILSAHEYLGLMIFMNHNPNQFRSGVGDDDPRMRELKKSIAEAEERKRKSSAGKSIEDLQREMDELRR